MAMSQNNRLSEQFYIIREFAIISVAYAHSISLPEAMLQRVGAALGVFGVPLFLFCSGFYFRYSNWTNLIHKLSKHIISPWIIWGTFGFCISYSLEAIAFRINTYLPFIFGHGTWLYYIPAYLAIRCIFNTLNTTAFIVCAIVISILSNIITFTTTNDIMIINDWITPYQNPLNWIGYYGIGLLCNRYAILDKLFCTTKFIKVSILILFIALFVSLVLDGSKITYWNPWVMCLCLTSLMLIPIIAHHISSNRILEILGYNSLLIYLLHIQLGIGFTNIILNAVSIPGIITLILKPILVLALTMALIIMMKRVLGALHLVRFNKYLGIA